jgi:peptide/nickel transport system substrate-binding protein
MVYEVGVDALDLMQPSTQTRVFTVRRPYQYLVILNVKRPALREKAIRRALNAAIDRRALVEQILDGHGTPADGPVWPSHWAYSADLPVFRYQPTRIDHGNKRIRFTCIVPDASTERVALYLQRQLEAVGVDLELQSMPLTEARKRVAVGDFDFFLVDAVHGPTMFRPYWFWYSNGFQNFGNFNSKEVDDAFDHIKNAADDAAYRLGVAALQKAVIEDPPAIFLAWTERARAVSSRFEVPAEPGTDIISSLRLWRPARAPLAASRN